MEAKEEECDKITDEEPPYLSAVQHDRLAMQVNRITVLEKQIEEALLLNTDGRFDDWIEASIADMKAYKEMIEAETMIHDTQVREAQVKQPGESWKADWVGSTNQNQNSGGLLIPVAESSANMSRR